MKAYYQIFYCKNKIPLIFVLTSNIQGIFYATKFNEDWHDILLKIGDIIELQERLYSYLTYGDNWHYFFSELSKDKTLLEVVALPIREQKISKSEYERITRYYGKL